MRTKSKCFARLIFLILMLISYTDRASIAETTTPEETPQAKTETTLKAGTHRATVNVRLLNLRKEASAESRILGVLEKDDLLEITAVSGDWLKVITPSKKSGWVHRHYVETDLEVEGESPATSNETVKTLAPPVKKSIAEKDLAPKASKPAQKQAEKPDQKAPQDLRKMLESVWSAYREAHRDGKRSLYKNTCSAHSYGTLVNTLAAVREELKPEDLIFFYDRMPDLTTRTFLELTENGPTAGLLYVDESQKKPDPNLPPPKRFLFIKFVQESWGWTVDGSYTTSLPKYRIDGSENQFDYASLPEGLVISGKVRPAPKALKKLKVRVVKGALDISSFGYKTEVSINGFLQGKVENTDYSGNLSGGLKKGMNKIEIVIAKSDKTEIDLPPKITVYHQSNAGEKKEAFHYEPENSSEGRQIVTFAVE